MNDWMKVLMNEWNLIERQYLIKWSALYQEVNAVNELMNEWMKLRMNETLSRG